MDSKTQSEHHAEREKAIQTSPAMNLRNISTLFGGPGTGGSEREEDEDDHDEQNGKNDNDNDN